MKKNIIILIAVLVGSYFILKIFNMNSEFFPEKMYYQALKAEDELNANPNMPPQKLANRIELKLTRILQLFPNSEVARKADIKLGEFYIKTKRYGSAIAQMNKIIEKLERDRDRLAMAYFLKGYACEKEDRWTEALKQYRVVLNNYPDTPIGLQMPMHIWNYYILSNKEAEAKQAYGDTVQFYKKLESENSDKPLGYMASLFLIRTYGKANDAQNAIATIEDHINKYYTPVTLGKVVPLVETVVVDKFKDPVKAIAIYKTILERSKDTKLNTEIEKRIAALEKVAAVQEAPKPAQEPAKAQ